MMRLFKIVLMAVLAFIGGWLVDLGARVWLAAHRTIETIFDVASSSDPDALHCGCPNPFFDTDYIAQRIGGVMILLPGIGVFVLAVREIFKKPDDSAA